MHAVRRLLLISVPMVMVSAAGAQTGAAPAPAATPQLQSRQPESTASPTVLRTGANLVLLDVVVQDGSGKPVRNLPRSAFRVTESKAPQTVSSFEEHSNATPPAPGRQLPPMPPGTFTDYTAVPSSGALDILLVDVLNTPMQDQSYLRDQLQQYVRKAAPGSRIAIFGLNTRLYLLQGFTSDLTTLKDAIDHKLIPRSSNLMDNPMDGSADTTLSDTAAEAGLDAVSSNLQQLETIQQSYQLQLRTQYTLDAFNTLAHYLAAFPGRKNLIWFSGSFPIDILPDPSLDNAFAVMETNDEEFRETTNLLTRGEVAVYPVDARGLMSLPMFQASSAGTRYARNPSAMSNDLSKFNASQASEHITMEQMANDTGGRAYYNTNGLADAVANALNSGANYYTLSYTPTDRNQHGEYRNIRVDLSNDFAAKGMKLYYRRGYYADDPKAHSRHAEGATPSAQAEAASNPASPAYGRAVMSRGAPEPQEILFKVRVLPASAGVEASLSPTDTPDPASPFKGPYRRYDIDYAALGSNLHLEAQPNGNHTGSVEFTTFVYSPDGKLLNAVGHTVRLNLSPEKYGRFVQSGLGMHMQVSAPAKGEAFLRIAVHDISANRYGVVELSTAKVSRLQPAPAAAPIDTPSAVPPAPPPQ